MNIKTRVLLYPMLWLLLSIGVVRAQQTCAPLVLEALRALDQNCAGTGANQACYGYDRLEVAYRVPDDAGRFAAPADIIDVDRLGQIRTSPLNEQQQHWGLALLRLRANVPNALPGQLVSLLVMGGAQVTDRAAAGQEPMQAFQLTTSADGPACSGVPTSSLTIQSPRGLQVSFNVNGVDFSMGSTINLRAESGQFRLSTLAGRARLGDRVVPVGFSVRGSLTADGDLDLDSLSDIEIIEAEDAIWSQMVAGLPDSLFDDPIDALTPELLQALSAIDADWLEYLDPYVLTDALIDLLEQGIDPAELDDIGLEDFYYLAADWLEDDALFNALAFDIDNNGAVIFELEDTFGIEDDDPILSLDDFYADSVFDDAGLDDLLYGLDDADGFDDTDAVDLPDDDGPVDLPDDPVDSDLPDDSGVIDPPADDSGSDLPDEGGALDPQPPDEPAFSDPPADDGGGFDDGGGGGGDDGIDDGGGDGGGEDGS